MVSSEVVPYAKTGGLADVAGALAVELAKLGHEVCLLFPCYRQVKSLGYPLTEYVHSSMPDKRLPTRIVARRRGNPRGDDTR